MNMFLESNVNAMTRGEMLDNYLFMSEKSRNIKGFLVRFALSFVAKFMTDRRIFTISRADISEIADTVFDAFIDGPVCILKAQWRNTRGAGGPGTCRNRQKPRKRTTLAGRAESRQGEEAPGRAPSTSQGTGRSLRKARGRTSRRRGVRRSDGRETTKPDKIC